jgi:hypothetical protein
VEGDFSLRRERHAGWIILGFGLADLARLPVEISAFREGGMYLAVLFLDGVNIVLGITSGLALPRNPKWGWDASMAAWGFLAGNSLVLLVWCLPKYLDGILGGHVREEIISITPRMIFYVATLLVLPYAAGFAWRRPIEHRSQRKWLVTMLAGGALVSAGLSLLITWGSR